MPTQERRPELDAAVSIYDVTQDITIIGRVTHLLSQQFTITISHPTYLHGKIHFIFYSDEWKLFQSDS